MAVRWDVPAAVWESVSRVPYTTICYSNEVKIEILCIPRLTL
jgi:nicotinamide mononucleotide (NMN) deamidase PncC